MGRRAITFLLLLTAGLCGFAAAAVEGGGTAALALAVCDLDGSELSEDLISRLESQSGTALTLCDEKEGERLLLLGEAEGLLTVPAGYGGRSSRGRSPPSGAACGRLS